MKRFLAGALLLFLAGCAEPPVSSAPAELLTPPSDGHGVAVLPPQGLPPVYGARLQKALTDALIAAGAPASMEAAPRAGALVAAAAKLTPAPPRDETLLITWAVQRPGETAPIYLTQTEITDAGRSAEGPPADRLAVIAGRAAAALAEVLNPTGQSAQPAASTPEKPRFAVRIGKVSGAPGDGDVSLSRSMGFALRDMGVPVVEKDGPGVWRVDGLVTVGPPRGDVRKLTVRWALVDPSGVEQAAAEQANDAPTAALAKHWGPLAALVTQAAAEGLAPALSQAHDVTNAAPAAGAAPTPPPAPAVATPPAPAAPVKPVKPAKVAKAVKPAKPAPAAKAAP